jgi:leucyl-tRNA synthetase
MFIAKSLKIKQWSNLINKTVYRSIINRENKFMIMKLDKSNNHNANTNISDIAEIYTRYYSLKGKKVFDINRKYDQNEKDSISLKVYDTIFNKLPSHTVDCIKYYNTIENNIDKLAQWPKSLRNSIKKNINKLTKYTIDFEIVNETNNLNQNVAVEFDNPELLYGVTFLILGKDSGLFDKKKVKEEECLLDSNTYAINPINKEKIKIFVSCKYQGILPGVPGHNGDHFQIAKKHGIAIKFVVKPLEELKDTLVEKGNIPTAPISTLTNIPTFGNVSFTDSVKSIKLDNADKPVII